MLTVWKWPDWGRFRFATFYHGVFLRFYRSGKDKSLQPVFQAISHGKGVILIIPTGRIDVWNVLNTKRKGEILPVTSTSSSRTSCSSSITTFFGNTPEKCVRQGSKRERLCAIPFRDDIDSRSVIFTTHFSKSRPCLRPEAHRASIGRFRPTKNAQSSNKRHILQK